MRRLKHEANFGKRSILPRMASWAVLVGMTSIFGPTGCSNSLQQASARYREQHQNRGQLLGDAAVEKLQACVDEFSNEVTADSLPVSGVVQMDREGRVYDVAVTGIPKDAQNLAACTREALGAVAVPDLPLRATATQESTNASAKPTGNELANPAVLVEVAILLGEFAAQHGAKAIIYAVTIQVLSAIAIESYKKLSKRCRKVKEDCIMTCGDSNLPTGTYSGDPFHACVRECMERAKCW